MFLNSHIQDCKRLTLALALGVLAHASTPMAQGVEIGTTEIATPPQVTIGTENGGTAENQAVNVAFPGAPPAAKAGVPVPVAIPFPVPVPVVIPVPAPSAPRPLAQERNSLVVSRMNGEVHFKHVQGPRLDPSRALNIQTGAGNSWCEFKMQNCTARVWANTQISVFPDTGVVYLKKGALIVHVDRGNAARYSIVAGDFACRIQGTAVRVQRDERRVDFQVLNGTVTVFNKLTGEVFSAGQVTQPTK